MAFRRNCGFLLLGLCLPCDGQPPSQNGLADASLEELMNIEVTSVSRKAQRLSSTAASVFVITSKDIQASGITVLPELLRLAPGVQVSRLSSGSWAVGIRGFNDEYSNKLLVLVDGRSVYNQFYAGVFWDTLNIPVDTIDRIEVIRGPGAAMWGTNAVNGVINVITKSAKATQGLMISGTGGSESTSTAGIRYGGQAGGASYRLGVQNAETDPFQIVSSVSPSRGWINRSGDFRLDWDVSAQDSLQVSGGVYETSLGVVVPEATISSPGAAPSDARIGTSGGDVAALWEHVFSETSSIAVRFDYDHMYRNDPQGAADIHTIDYGFQHHVTAGARNDIIWGFSVREDDFRSTPTPALRLNPLSTNRDEIAVFGEDEISLIPNRLSFIAGAQVSHTETIGYAVQPTVRLLWTPTTNLSSWIAVSRAERTPSLSDQGIDYYESPMPVATGVPSMPSMWGIVHFVGNPEVRQETVLAYEAGQRVQASKAISFDISTFYNVYRHLDSVFTGTPQLLFSSGIPYLEIPATTGNDRHGESYGAELAVTWNVAPRWRLNGGYSWLRVETRPYGTDINMDQYRTSSATPHHQWEARSDFDLTRKVSINSALYYYSAMPQTGIPQHLRVDLRIGWRLTPKIELSIGVQDALEAYHLEYESTRFDQVAEIPRNFYGKVIWRF